MERSNTWKKWTAAAAAGCVAAGLLLGGCGGTTTAAEERSTTGQEQTPGEKPVLRVGFDGTTVPCSWTQRDDSGGALPKEAALQMQLTTATLPVKREPRSVRRRSGVPKS